MVYPNISTTALALGDLKGNKRLDLIVTNQQSNTVGILWSRGGGAFSYFPVSYAVGYNPAAVAVEDLNADGKLDLAVVNEGADSVSVLLNKGIGTFGTHVPYRVGTSPSAVATGDLNGDGRPDLAVVSVGSATVSVLLNRGDGTFTIASRMPWVRLRPPWLWVTWTGTGNSTSW